MTHQKQIILRPTGSTVYRRRQPLLHSSPSSTTSKRFAEVAGGTTAECTALWCCGPCTLINMFVLVVYKVPAGICKKALKNRRRRRMIKKGLLPLPSSGSSSVRGEISSRWSHYEGMVSDSEEVAVVVMDKELMQWEKEMWEMFYDTGFWRSPSQREKEREQKQ